MPGRRGVLVRCLSDCEFCRGAVGHACRGAGGSAALRLSAGGGVPDWRLATERLSGGETVLNKFIVKNVDWFFAGEDLPEGPLGFGLRSLRAVGFDQSTVGILGGMGVL